MQVQIETQTAAIHPNEVVVTIGTVDGSEQLVVHKRSMIGSSLEIGYPIAAEGDRYLIELPRETFSGLWRIWVPKESIVDTVERRYA